MLHVLSSIQCFIIFLLILMAGAKVDILPPTPGNYVLQNAASGMLLSLSQSSGPDTQPGDPIVEFPPADPIQDFPNQIWVFSSEDGDTGTLRALSPPSFINCPTISAGSICTGNEDVITAFGLVGVVGGFIIEPADGLAITGTGQQLGQVFLAPTTGALNQIWVFITPPAS